MFQRTSLGAFGANTVVRGFIRRDKTQLELGLRQLFGPRLRSSQTVIGCDIGWVHIHNLPSSHPLDEDSWGYRLVGQLTYDSVLGGVTLQPGVVWAQDVDGITPGPRGAFIAGRRIFSVGLGGEYLNRWTADLSYTKFFGSSFIEVLFRVWNRVNGAGGKFALAGLTSYCREVLEITHLDKLWPMLPNADEAVSAIA